MPGSNKTERNRQLKANRDAGLGDEMGRLPSRVKDAGTILTCEVCKAELKCTKCEWKSYVLTYHNNMNIMNITSYTYIQLTFSMTNYHNSKH